jgi:opacity protein-like surface antigen
MKKYAVAAFAAVGLMSLPVMAAEDSGFYVGAGLGYGSIDTDSLTLPEPFFAEDQFFKLDDSATAWKIFGGWRLNKYIAFELDYMDLGTVSTDGVYSFDVVPMPTSTQDVYVKADLGLSGWAPYVIGSYPIGMFELSGKVGYVWYDYDIDVYARDQTSLKEGWDSVSDSDDDFAWGLGVGVTVFDNLNLKLEYEAIEVSDANVDVWWLTGAWRF